MHHFDFEIFLRSFFWDMFVVFIRLFFSFLFVQNVLLIRSREMVAATMATVCIPLIRIVYLTTYRLFCSSADTFMDASVFCTSHLNAIQYFCRTLEKWHFITCTYTLHIHVLKLRIFNERLFFSVQFHISRMSDIFCSNCSTSSNSVAQQQEKNGVYKWKYFHNSKHL